MDSLKSSSKSSNSSNRSKAASVNNSGGGGGWGDTNLADSLRNVAGINTVNAAGSNIRTTQSDKPTGILGSLFMKGIEPLRGIYSNLTGGMGLPELGLSEALGLTTKVPNLTYNLGNTPETDPTTGATINPSNPSNVINTPAPYINWDTFNQSQGNDTSNRNDTRVTSNRNPRIVTNPTPVFTPPQSTNISNIFQPQSTPDYTPQQQSPEATIQKLLGRGYFSNGIASNGKGDYGVEGSLTGTGGQDMNWLDQMNPFYTPDAMAADNTMFPQTNQLQSMISGGNDYTKSPLYQDTINRMYPNGMENYQSQSNQVANQSAPQYTPQTNPGGSQGGGVSQQYAQGTPQQQQTQAFDNSGYKKQEKAQKKAQKKALDELIKSIKSQYSQSTTEGTAALEKSKQEDLLKLSGLFSFANQSPDSEQRIQYQQRTNNDYAGQLSDFLNKISQGQSKDISGAKQNYQSSLADIMAQQQKAQADYENQMWERQYKIDSLKQNGSGGGFTPVQQQSYLTDYSKDLQATLGKYSKLGYGKNGRELAANELAQRWGLIFEPQSIAQDVAQQAPNGWEGQYSQMYGNNNDALRALLDL